MPQQLQRKWCHGNIPVIRQLIERPVQTKMWMTYAKEGGVIPNTGCPTCRWHGNEERASDSSDTVQTRASHTTKHSIMVGHLGGYTFEACVSGRFKIVEGSSRSRVIGEVVVYVS